MSAVTIGGGLTGVGSGATIGNTMDNKFSIRRQPDLPERRAPAQDGRPVIRYRQNRYYAGNNGALGSFTYNGSLLGLPYGDFLLNCPGQQGPRRGHRQVGPPPLARRAVFIQDDWKVARNFTLNLGMRWEYTQPIYEVADRQVNINTYTGELLYAGKDGNSRALYKPYYKQFKPRIGFAWTPACSRQAGVSHGLRHVRASWRARAPTCGCR